jgi:hypothetical protein
MKFINWPVSGVLRFARIFPDIIAARTGEVVNTAGAFISDMAPFAYWDATWNGWEEHGFRNNGKNRMRELIKEYGGKSQLYYGIIDTQGLERLMPESEWKAEEKSWLHYCIDNGKWPFSVWLVPTDVELLGDIGDNQQVTKLIDDFRITPVQKHTLHGWMLLNPATGKWQDAATYEKLGATGLKYPLEHHESNMLAGFSGGNYPADPEQKKMEFLFPWNLQMEQIEDLTMQSWESVIEYARANSPKNKLNMHSVRLEFRSIHHIYNQILQEYERSGGKLVGFLYRPQI